jgi:hypothetical protein
MPRLKTGAEAVFSKRCVRRAEFFALPYRCTPLSRFLHFPRENGQRIVNLPTGMSPVQFRDALRSRT